jgi:hypothetical protein
MAPAGSVDDALLINATSELNGKSVDPGEGRQFWQPGTSHQSRHRLSLVSRHGLDQREMVRIAVRSVVSVRVKK